MSASADAIAGFQHDERPPRLVKGRRRGKPGGAGPDDDAVKDRLVLRSAQTPVIVTGSTLADKGRGG
jgi:hypothetical protein